MSYPILPKQKHRHVKRALAILNLMFRCNLTKSDESTSFILNVDSVFVRNCVLRYINENAKRSAESILKLYIHFLLSFPVTSGAS